MCGGDGDHDMQNVKQMKSLNLAYIGDAVYELHVRTYLLETGQVKPNELHQKAVTYVAAEAQAAIVRHWLETGLLTETEAHVVKRGRNAKSGSVPKRLNVQTYRYSTGFEALIGYHYLLKSEQRLQVLLQEAVQFINEGNV